MIELIAKVTLLLGAGALLSLLLRDRSAAVRHFVWALTLGSALLLPFALKFAPKVGVPLPFGHETEPTAMESVLSHRTFIHVDDGAAAPAHGVLPMEFALPKQAKSPFRVSALLLGLWAFGSLVVLGRCLAGHIGLALLAHRARTVDSVEFTELFNELLSKSKAWRPIRVAMSEEISSPVTWGFGSAPVILLPPDAESWTIDRMRVVLLHELAHVARRDDATQLLGHLTTALYWFHPLAWIASRELREESEHAADDRVLNGGTPGPDYADHLVEIARRVRSLRFIDAVALNMARPSHLERRVRAVLDDERSRRTNTFFARAGVFGVLAALMIPLACFEREVQSAPRFDEFPRQPIAKRGPRPSPRPMPRPLPMPSPEVNLDDDPDNDHDDDEDNDPGHVLDASAGGTISISAGAGGSIEVRGWDQDRVAVKGEHVQIRPDGKTIHVTTEMGMSSDFDVRVPKNFNVIVNSAGGDFEIADVEGALKGQTGGGSIELRRTRGTANLTTGGGDIEVTDSVLDGSVSTGGGSVTFTRVEGTLRPSSGSGPVVYERQGVKHFESGGGDIQLDQTEGNAIVSTGGGDIEIKRANGDLKATTGGGDIQINAAVGSVRASTGAGDVEVNVIEAREAGQTIDLSTGTGDVTLTVPVGMNATFELETTFNKGSGPHEIETHGFEMEKTVSNGRVRARGKVGDGRNLVRIRSMNGDIELKARASAH